EKRETLEFQNAVMSHLGERIISGFISQVCKTRSGEEIATIRADVGSTHFVRLLTYHPGALLAEINPHSLELLHSLGRFLGEIDKGLEGFSHPASHRELKWDLQGALWITDYMHHIADPDRRCVVEHFIQQFETRVVPNAASLRTSVVHNDAND